MLFTGESSLTGFKQAKGDATELLAKKNALEAEKKEWVAKAAEKQVELNKKLNTIGNIVDSTVPVSDTEVRLKPAFICCRQTSLHTRRIRTLSSASGLQKVSRSRSAMSFLTTRF